MKTCPECNSTFTSKRADAVFCSPTCRSRAHQRRQSESTDHADPATAVQNDQHVHNVPNDPHVHPLQSALNAADERVQRTDSISELRMQLDRGVREDLAAYRKREADLMNKIASLSNRQESLPTIVRNTKERLRITTAEVTKYQELIQLDDTDLYDAILNDRYITALANREPNAERWKTRRTSNGRGLLLGLNAERIKERRHALNAELQRLNDTCRELLDHIGNIEVEMVGIPKATESANSQLRDVRFAKDRLYQIFKNNTLQSSNAAIPKTAQLATPERKGQTSLTAEDLKNMSFDTFELPTELGRFLGKISRDRLAIALTGDSGAGKTYFAFELTQLFSEHGYSTKYFCLEEGIGHLTQEKIHLYNLPDDVIFQQQATISDVRRDATKFDVIVIDSFSKLDAEAEEFERLRTDFTRTIFIIIFQKTSTGSIRGGSSIIFNSAAAIDVVRDGDTRIAHMVKSRYGTQDWKYSITEQRIIERS